MGKHVDGPQDVDSASRTFDGPHEDTAGTFLIGPACGGSRQCGKNREKDGKQRNGLSRCGRYSPVPHRPDQILSSAGRKTGWEFSPMTTRVPGATSWVSHRLPPISDPFPMRTLPRMVVPE